MFLLNLIKLYINEYTMKKTISTTKTLGDFQSALEKSAEDLRKAQLAYAKAEQAATVAREVYERLSKELSDEFNRVKAAARVVPLGV
jgi:hypothetical protein